jgi:hypothetical protein
MKFEQELDQVSELAQAEHEPSSLAGLLVPEQKDGQHLKNFSTTKFWVDSPRIRNPAGP